VPEREAKLAPAKEPTTAKPKAVQEAPLEIRDAKSKDAAQLASLFALLEHDIDEKALARSVKALAKAGEPVLVAVRGKEVIGACGIHRMIVPHREKPVGRITILVVVEAARKLGLGRMLVEEAERRLAKLGCGLIEVTSNDRLTQAHAFYRHLGFERTSMRFAKALPSG
jgi:ribosomal protein S18 acetylase RimI-like enzyme